VLGLPAPAGGCFLFVDVSARLDARGLQGFLEDAFAAGVVVAPGSSAGAAYDGWIRLCFTVVPPDLAVEAARRLARPLA
jgi:aspartate/methionine/tyrosine aminotransferase